LVPASSFTDIASGRRDDRVEYRKMLSLLAPGDVVVVMFLDRFGRNPREILRRYWELEEQGVQVVSVNEDLKEELLLLFRAGMAGAESRRIGERTKQSQIQAGQSG
jgi:DNA invertase Pin-like site-specific DNA recombinase